MLKAPERWRPILGFDGYEVSDLGHVRSWRAPSWANRGKRRKTPLIRKLIPCVKTGYLYVQLCINNHRTLRQVHVMVLEAFRGERPIGFETRHLNGDKVDNRLRNLRWGTRQEQFADQVRHGTDTCGSRNGMAKLTSTQVKAIRRRLGVGDRGVDLAREYHVPQSTISNIKRGVRYASD